MDARSPPKPRVTIKTVAIDAGVSVAAVSKVTRNAYGVSEALRQKVQTSIERLGYRPNIAARAMRGRTNKIGVLLCEIANPFLAQVMDGMNDVLAESHYQALMGMGESNMPVEASLIESMIDLNMDGLILVAPQMSGNMLAKYARQIPMVVIGHHEATATNFDTVNSDDQEGAAIAVRSFLAEGHRNIAMLSLTMDDSEATNVSSQREIGFARAIGKAGLPTPARIHRINYVPVVRESEIEKFVETANLPRALFCWSDIDGIHLINSARRRGIRIPEDLSVIGYDNSSVASLGLVNLASIDQSGKRIGSLAVELLQSRIAGRSASSHLLIEPTLVKRASLARK
jgi:LacI family transcriptional regulator